MTYENDLDAIRSSIEDHEIDPVGQRIREAFSALDDLIVMANLSTTRDQVRAERVLIGQLLTRCQTLASFALIPQAPALKVIRNG